MPRSSAFGSNTTKAARPAAITTHAHNGASADPGRLMGRKLGDGWPRREPQGHGEPLPQDFRGDPFRSASSRTRPAIRRRPLVRSPLAWELRANRPIARGEELYCDYGDLHGHCFDREVLKSLGH